MEEKINIAEILKDKPQGTKLYSPICGECKLSYIESEKSEPQIGIESDAFGAFYFWDDGKAYVEGECLLFPSDKMRDWAKFSWNKGDVLKNTAYEERVIFDGFLNDDYTYFKGKHPLDCSDKLNITYHEECNCFTGNYRLESTDASQTYINTIEERLGGKLNRETLEIENQTEFKDGDIAFADYGNRQDVFIVSGKTGLSEGYSSFISLDLSSLILSMACRTTFFKKDICKLRLATEEEKQQLFDALAKEGKAWDAEKKALVDLKQKVELKPFDRCIWKIRNCEGSIWKASFVSYVDEYGATPMGVSIDEDLVNLTILPYNDQTKLLVGTTDEWKGGEG